MNTLEDIDRAVAVFRSQAVALATTDLERATPCVGWDVRTLIGHVAGIYQAVSDALHGERVDLVAALAPLGNEPERTLDAAATRMSHAWREPGAFDRTLPTTIRDVPAVLAARIVVGDALLHAWDLARARAQELVMPTDLAEAQLALMQQYYDPATRGPGRGFALAVDWPADAPVQERLIALSGRDPACPDGAEGGTPGHS